MSESIKWIEDKKGIVGIVDGNRKYFLQTEPMSPFHWNIYERIENHDGRYWTATDSQGNVYKAITGRVKREKHFSFNLLTVEDAKRLVER